MRYLSVCSGIEAATNAWHGLGWEPVAFSEIDPFASAVLAARFPNVPNLGDLEKYREWNIAPGSVDVLVGGTPCQSFSVAGLRKGLADPRGNLALVYLAMVDRLRPRWVVWENVPGVLSSNSGRDFGAFLGGLAQLGYGFAYRVMDAQYVRVESHPRAVPQRRRRVFVVGHSGGDWQRAAEVLLEPEGVRGDLAPRREAGKGAPRGARPGAPSGGIAGTVASKWSKGTGGPAGDECQNLVPAPLPFDTYNQTISSDGSTQTLCSRGHTPGGVSHLVPAIVAPLPFDTTQVTSALNRSNPQHGDPCHPLTRGGAAPSVAFPWPVDVADPITANEGATYTHEGTTFRMHNVVPDAVPPLSADADKGDTLVAAPTLTSANDPSRSTQSSEVTQQVAAVHTAPMAVRRLTPRECERLQGFPDDWTAITYRGKPAADGPRYAAIGNSMAVPVMRWLGERIQTVQLSQPAG